MGGFPLNLGGETGFPTVPRIQWQQKPDACDHGNKIAWQQECQKQSREAADQLGENI